jgi:hypothetical protein
MEDAGNGGGAQQKASSLPDGDVEMIAAFVATAVAGARRAPPVRIVEGQGGKFTAEAQSAQRRRDIEPKAGPRCAGRDMSSADTLPADIAAEQQNRSALTSVKPLLLLPNSTALRPLRLSGEYSQCSPPPMLTSRPLTMSTLPHRRTTNR